MSLLRFHLRTLMIVAAIVGIVLAAAVRHEDATVVGIVLVLLTALSLWIGYRFTESAFKSDRPRTPEEHLAYAITIFVVSIVNIILSLLVGLYLVSWVTE